MKEKIERIKEEAKYGIEVLNSIIKLAEELLNEVSDNLSNLTGTRSDDGTVTLNWSGETDKELDVQFQVKEGGKWHSIKWMMNDDLDTDDDDYNPPQLEDNDNSYIFQVPREKIVNVRLLEGTFDTVKNEFIVDREIGRLWC